MTDSVLVHAVFMLSASTMTEQAGSRRGLLMPVPEKLYGCAGMLNPLDTVPQGCRRYDDDLCMLVERMAVSLKLRGWTFSNASPLPLTSLQCALPSYESHLDRYL